MAERIDILLDADNDLAFYNGDFKTGGADMHHIEVLLITVPGAFKQSPLIGANVRSLLNGKVDVAARRDIKLQLAADGYKAKSVSIDNGTLVVDI